MTEFNPGGAASLNQAVKLRYEANPDTNSFTDAEKAKLGGVEDGATANVADAALRDRATHTGTQAASTISDFDAAVAAAPSVVANTAKVTNATHTGDVIGDTALSISDNAVTYSKMQDVSEAARLLGRGDAGAGDPEEITLGAGLTMTGTTLSASGGGGSPAGSGAEVQYRDGGAFGAASNLSIGSAGNPILGSNPAQPALPPADTIELYARRRAGADWLEVLRPNGREFPIGPHMGLNRTAWWAPNNGSNIVFNGMPRSFVGTTSTPTLSAGSLANSARRWRLTSSATANRAATERTAVFVCWRGDAAGLGGFTYTNRISLTSLQSGSVGFFGLKAQTNSINGGWGFANFVDFLGFGFTEGTDTNWQVISNDGSGAPSQVDTGIAINTTDLLTFLIYAAPNDTAIWMRMTNESSGASFEHQLTSDIPASTVFLSIHNYLNNGGNAAAVAYDCSGVYLETDY